MRAKLSHTVSSLAIAAALSVASVALGACGSAPAPTTPPVPPPDPRLVEAGPIPESEPDAKDADGGVSAGPLDASPAPPVEAGAGAGAAAPIAVRSGPVEDEADAVERATRAANVALDKAYASFVKKTQIAPTHTGPWTKSSTRQVKGNAQAGWEVTFTSHPPAGFDHEAVVHVSPRGVLTVKKASAGFSPD